MQHYSESIAAPTARILTYSCASSLCVAFMLTWMSTPSAASYWPVFVQIWLPAWCFFALALRLTQTVRIKIIDMLQWDGRTAATLVVTSPKSRGKTYVPIAQVTEAVEIRFEDPPAPRSGADATKAESAAGAKAPGFWHTFLALRHPGDAIPVSTCSVPGYTGPGLLITYQADSLNDRAKASLWALRIPTAHSQRLLGLLNETVHQTT